MFDKDTQDRIANYRKGLSPDRINAVNALRAKFGGAAPAMSDVGQAVYGGNEAIAAGPKIMQGLSDGAGGLASILGEAFARMSGMGSGGDSTPTPSPEALKVPRTITKSAPFPAASNSGMPGAPGGQTARREQDIVMDDEGAGVGSKPIAPPSGKPSISQAARTTDAPAIGGGPGGGLAEILQKVFAGSMIPPGAPAPISVPAASGANPTRIPSAMGDQMESEAIAGFDKQLGDAISPMNQFSDWLLGQRKRQKPMVNLSDLSSMGQRL